MELKPPYRTMQRRGAPESGKVGMLNGKMIYANTPAQALNLSLRCSGALADGPFAAQCPPQSPFAVIYPSTSQLGTTLIVRGGTQVLQQSFLQAAREMAGK